MLVLRRTKNSFHTIDGSCIRPDLLPQLVIAEIETLLITTDQGQVPLGEVFDIVVAKSINEQTILIDGDCNSIAQLGMGMREGTLCVLGNVGNYAGRGMQGGRLVITGNARDHLASGMRNGFVYVGGNCEQHLVSPEPGKKSGMRGGDVLIAGNCGARACERMRRGTVFIGGSAGEYAVSQMIAGTLVVMGEMAGGWGGGMRRGSVILSRDYAAPATASLSHARDFELSFLPLLWKHMDGIQADALQVINTSVAISAGWLQTSPIPSPRTVSIPRTRWAQRQIGDLNVGGRGEVLVLRRISSPEVV
jgi:formylmethanofuran dehydrogenase subunit C